MNYRSSRKNTSSHCYSIDYVSSSPYISSYDVFLSPFSFVSSILDSLLRALLFDHAFYKSYIILALDYILLLVHPYFFFPRRRIILCFLFANHTNFVSSFIVSICVILLWSMYVVQNLLDEIIFLLTIPHVV